VVRQETAEEIEAKRLALARRQRVVESHGSEGDGAAKPKQETVVRAQPKVGRNDPCPCGSGKKYKKCHGATEATA
jgi:preprotein translocase subunit SecA